MKYTFRYRDQFDESNDDWLTCVETTSNELLGAYTRAKDDAITLAFGGRGKKRLNRVFDVIGFVYPDYTYPFGHLCCAEGQKDQGLNALAKIH